MKNASLFAVIILLLVFGCSQNNENKTEPVFENFVVGYLYPGNRVISESEIDANHLTHIIYSFANLQNGVMVEGYDTDHLNFQVLTKVRDKHPHLKLLVAVGGWTWSGNFSDMALNPQTRDAFIQSAVAFLEKYKLDGLDIDWEYPGLPGNNNTHRPEDKENFTVLIRELRQALNANTGNTRPYLLTIAAGAFQAYVDNTQMEEVAKYLDMIFLMTYDFTGEWSNITGHHTNLHTPEFNLGANSVASSLEIFLNAGLDAKQLVIGAAFYGRGWQNVRNKNNGLGQSGQGLTNANLSYSSIVMNYLTDPEFEQHWDHTASAPYLWNPTDKIFITYDNLESVREKARFAKRNNLKGVMFWQYFSDHQNELLKTLYNEMMNPE